MVDSAGEGPIWVGPKWTGMGLSLGSWTRFRTALQRSAYESFLTLVVLISTLTLDHT